MRISIPTTPTGTPLDAQAAQEARREEFEKLTDAFNAMRTADREDPFPLWGIRDQRLAVMEKLIQENLQDIVSAIDKDFGRRSKNQTSLLDILPTLKHIQDLRGHGKKMMKPRKRHVDTMFYPASAFVQPQPKGLIGVIGAWNYPLYLAFGPAAQAIAAGNRVVIKFPEATPTFSKLMCRLINKYFGKAELFGVFGDAEFSASFTKLPFDHLIFTGSGETGVRVLESTAAALTPVTLELGGKSPVIISPNYPLKRAAERIIFAKLVNAGQTCIAPDYILVEKRNIPRLVGLLKECAKKLFPKEIRDPEYTSIINTKEFTRLVETLNQASKSSKIENVFEGEQIDIEERLLAPQIVLDPSLTSDVMQKEIFGPVLPIVPYPDENVGVAVDFVCARQHPLSLYLFDNDPDRQARIIRETRAGGMTINDTLWHAVQASLPFGGIGPSGMGAWRGIEGFDTFSHLKPVFIQSRFSFIGNIANPFSARAKKIVNRLISKDKSERKAQVKDLVSQNVKNFFSLIKKE